MHAWIKILAALVIGLMLNFNLVFAQQKPKLHEIRIALPSQTIGATHELPPIGWTVFDPK